MCSFVEKKICPQHGEYTSIISKVHGIVLNESGCPECFRIEKEKLERKEREARELARAKKEQERINLALSRSGIPEGFKSKKFDSFIAETENEKKALELSRKFVNKWDVAKQNGYGLFFFGKCGTGKSHLACSVLQSLIPRVSCAYVRVFDMIRYVRSSWSNSCNTSESDAIRMYIDIGLLVVDEIGVQSGSENEKQILFSIIDGRLSENKPTIFISNLSPAELSPFVGERLVDRIKGKCVPFMFTGHSKRKTISADVFD